MDPRLARLQNEIEVVVSQTTAEQLARHRPGKWCTAEILEHLYLTYTGTIKGFQRVAEAKRPLASQPTWKHGARKFVLLGLSYFPSGREAPSVARPRGLATEKVLAEIAPKVVEMDAIISACELSLGNGDLLDHPILGPLTGAQWRRFHLLHGCHHMKQIRELRMMRTEE